MSITSLLLAIVFTGAGPLSLSRDGQPDYLIVTPAQPTAVETSAAAELQAHLDRITGGTWKVAAEPQVPAQAKTILVGATKRAKELLPDLAPDKLGYDGIVMQTVGEHLVLTGHPVRGPLYAVYTFLEELGCRWWTSSESFVPSRPTLSVGPLQVRYVPPLRYREIFYRDAFDGPLAARWRLNGAHHHVKAELGGHQTFAGFVHTFYPLLPPDKYFVAHPEWYSEIQGKRVAQHGQLCLTNETMRRELTANALALLDKQPDAGLLSVSQNDWHGRCECAACKKVEEEEGSPAGPLLRFVNAVAADVEKKHPQVLVETLAYQYTRLPPKKVRPRDNVVIRLCSIECSFVQPLSGPQNEKFRADIEGWAAIAPRLFVWDYVTNFSHYLVPHPNLRVLGPNVRFFVDHKVVGLFEQGDAGTTVGDFIRLRAWLLARLLWNPQQDEKLLIREFLEGYYGPAAPHLQAYLDTLHDAAERSDVYLRCFMHDTAKWLDLPTLNEATRHMDAAARAVAGDPALAARVRRDRLPLDHVWLTRYYALQRTARAQGLPFGGPADPQVACDEFIELSQKYQNREFRERQPFGPYAETLRRRFRPPAAPPAAFDKLPPQDWLDIQDNEFRLHKPDQYVFVEKDPAASDGWAARMPGSHREWATSLPVSADMNFGNPWHCYAAVRCDAKATAGTAMTLGLYDSDARKGVMSKSLSVAQVAGKDYRLIDLGTHVLTPSMYFWFAPPQRPGEIEAVYVDRVFLVREGQGKNER